MEENNSINILTIEFEEQLQQRAIPFLRGAIIANTREGVNTLLHNHIDEGYRYSYPLVQYKTVNRKAVITCINEGVDLFLPFIKEESHNLTIGNEHRTMHIKSVNPSNFYFEVSDDLNRYKILEWLPLNKENTKAYHRACGLIEQISLLERILVGNILSMAKGLGVVIKDEIEVHICSVSSPTTTIYKNQPFLSFNAEFVTNISLPEYLCLGKNASLGHGMILRNNKKTIN